MGLVLLFFVCSFQRLLSLSSFSVCVCFFFYCSVWCCLSIYGLGDGGSICMLFVCVTVRAGNGVATDFFFFILYIQLRLLYTKKGKGMEKMRRTKKDFRNKKNKSGEMRGSGLVAGRHAKNRIQFVYIARKVQV